MKIFHFLAVALSLVAPVVVMAQSPRKVALVVGVQTYDHRDLSNLNFAAGDAARLSEALTGAGFQVTLMTATTGAKSASLQPTAANIRAQAERISQGLTKRDLILVALTGHGLQPSGASEAYFCPQDANPTLVAAGTGASVPQDPNSLIGLDQLLKQIHSRGVGQTLFLVDACRNEPLQKGAKSARKGIESIVFNVPEQAALLLSCSKGEFSFELEGLGNPGSGVFFHYVIEGLTGKAADPEDGIVTWDALTNYVKRRVAAKVTTELGGLGGRQTPSSIGHVEGFIALAKVRIDPLSIPHDPIQPGKKIVIHDSISGGMVGSSQGSGYREDFSTTLDGTLPRGWKVPRDALRVQTIGSRKMLIPAGQKMVFARLPEEAIAQLSRDFEMDLEFELRGAGFEVILQQGAATRRLLVTPGIVGGVPIPTGTRMFDPDKQPSSLRLMRNGDQVSVSMRNHAADNQLTLLRQFRCAGPISAVHVGLATNDLRRSSGLASVRCAAQGSGEIPSGVNSAFILKDERFLETVDGEFPEGWESKGGAIVTSTFGQPCIASLESGETVLKLPSDWVSLLAKDFLLEADIQISGGGSHSGSAIVELTMEFGKIANKLPVELYRGQLCVGEWKHSMNAASGPLIPPHSYCTVRLTREANDFSVGLQPLNGDTPITIARLPAGNRIATNLLVAFRGGGNNNACRLHGLRLQSSSGIQTAIPNRTSTAVAAPR